MRYLGGEDADGAERARGARRGRRWVGFILVVAAVTLDGKMSRGRETRGSARKNEAQLDSQFTIPRSCQSVSTYTQAFGFKSGISYTNVI